MINIRIFNTNGAPMELACAENARVTVSDVYEASPVYAETVTGNFTSIPVHNEYIGRKLAFEMSPVEAAYINVARKNYPVSQVPSKEDELKNNGVLIMKNAFRLIALQEPEMFIVEAGLKIHPVAMEAFMKIPRYYVQMVSSKALSECGIPIKKERKFIIGTKKSFVPRYSSYAPAKLSAMLEKDVDYGELPAYAKNRLLRKVNSHPCHIIEADDSMVPNITAHLAKDDSAILVNDGGHLRPLTVKEIARIQGYPDDFHFAGSKRQQITQMADSIGVGTARWLVNDVISHYFDNCYHLNC